MKWETACRFSTCVVRSILYLDTDFVDILLRVPQCYLFAYIKSVIKISKAGFKKWNCFRKAGLNTSLIVSIVGTETSVTKVISRKYKFHVLKWKMLISLSNQILFGQDPMLRVTAFLFGSIMFNLTSVTTVFPYPDTEILLILELRIIRWVVYNQLYDGRCLFAGYCSGVFCT